MAFAAEIIQPAVSLLNSSHESAILNCVKSALILGGTRYFGKLLVERLLDSGVEVTIATRGQTSDPFGNSVKRLVFDRSNAEAMRDALPLHSSWDVIFDQICYSPNDAASACEVFADRTGRYVLTSTQSVYQETGIQAEADFEPAKLPLQMGERDDFSYSDCKRLAEAVFFQKSKFPVAAIRIPIVLGPDDYTKRLEFHIQQIRNGRPIVVPNLDAKMCFIHSTEAARFIAWAGTQAFQGPINACSQGDVSIGKLLSIIAEQIARAPEIFEVGEESQASPFIGAESRLMDTFKAQTLGFQFSRVMDWLPRLIRSKSCNFSQSPTN